MAQQMKTPETSNVESCHKQRSHFLAVFIWLCVFKVSYWAMLIIALKHWGSLNLFYGLIWPDGERPTFLSHFASYDGSYYLSICETGYHAGSRTSAFYPLWPITIRLASCLAGDGYLVVGLVLANIFSLLSWFFFYWIVSLRLGSRTAKLALLFLIAFPGSLFYQFIYSESLFFFLMMALWWGLEYKRYDLAFGMAVLLPLTRPIGIFCFLPIFYHILTISPPGWLKCRLKWYLFLTKTAFVPQAQKTIMQSSLAFSRQKDDNPDIIFREWWLLLAPFFGWFIYLLLMLLLTGNPFDGFAAQNYWGVNSISNLWNVPKFVFTWFNPNTWCGYQGSFLNRFIFTLVVYCIPLLWKLDKSLLVWLYFLGILPAMSGMFTSSTRYLSVAFPFFIALGVYFEPTKRRWFQYCLLGVFAIIHIMLVWQYVNFYWAN